MLISKLIDQLLNEQLIGTYRAHYNQINNNITTSTSDIAMKYPVSGIGEGSYIEIEQELCYVIPGGVNASAKTLTVVRGVRGTAAAAHTAGANVSINPRFPRVSILNTMIEEAKSWPNSLYHVASVDTSVAPGVTSIDLNAVASSAHIIRPLSVMRRKTGTDSGRWILLNGWRYDKNGFADGSFDIYLAECPGSPTTIRIKYAEEFQGMDSWTEALSPDGYSLIPENMQDILKYGAAWRLVTGRETRRLFTEAEGQGRNAQEVPATANLQLGRGFKMLRDGRLAEEISRLRSLYGVRGR